MPTNARPRSLVLAWANGEITIGAACKIASSLTAEAVASVGFDYVYVDQQHGVLDNTAILSMFQAIAGAGAAPGAWAGLGVLISMPSSSRGLSDHCGV